MPFFLFNSLSKLLFPYLRRICLALSSTCLALTDILLHCKIEFLLAPFWDGAGLR